MTEIDWTTAACPDCGKNELADATYDSDQIDEGFTVYCQGCGFEIAGRDAGMVRSAIGVLMRWKAAS